MDFDFVDQNKNERDACEKFRICFHFCFWLYWEYSLSTAQSTTHFTYWTPHAAKLFAPSWGRKRSVCSMCDPGTRIVSDFLNHHRTLLYDFSNQNVPSASQQPWDFIFHTEKQELSDIRWWLGLAGEKSEQDSLHFPDRAQALTKKKKALAAMSEPFEKKFFARFSHFCPSWHIVTLSRLWQLLLANSICCHYTP